MKKLIVTLTVFVACLQGWGNYQNPAGDKLPILAYHSIPDSALSKMRFQQLADAGFNLSYSLLETPQSMQKALDSCKDSGVKQILPVNVSGYTAKDIVNLFKENEQVAGWAIAESPEQSNFATVAKLRDSILNLDDKHLIYVFLSNSTQSYLQNFSDQTGIGYLIYTYNPYLYSPGANNEAKEDTKWLTSLNTMRSLSASTSQPFWENIPTLSSASLPLYAPPSYTLMKIQAMTSLAYGAQGLQYNEYWATSTYYKNAIINHDGTVSGLYAGVKKVNESCQSCYSLVFKNVETVEVEHDSIPKSLPSCFATGTSINAQNLVYGHYKDSQYNYVLLLNKNCNGGSNLSSSMQLKLYVAEGTQEMGKTAFNVPEQGTRVLGAGDFIVLRWDNNSTPVTPTPTPTPLADSLRFCVDGITYVVTSSENKKVYVCSGTARYQGNLVIPDTVLYKNVTYKVTGIRCKALYNCTQLTSVSISEGVDSIGNEAFSNCSILKRVKFGKSLSVIGKDAFYACSSLDTVDLSMTQVEKIDTDAFSLCNALLAVKYPLTIKTLGYGVFSSCQNIKSVSYPNLEGWLKVDLQGVESSGVCWAQKLLIGGESLSDWLIPDGVAVIKPYAFFNAGNVTTVKLPESIDSIGDFAFSFPISVTCLAQTPPALSATAFGEGDETGGFLYVPAGTKSKYVADKYWSHFFLENKIIELGSTGINNVQVQNAGLQGPFYDLLGRKVKNPGKGIFIQNGKKVYIQ